MTSRLNKYKSPGAKRLMLEAQELKDNTEDYFAQPIDDNLFEWHFTVRGPPDTAFDGGYYHGRLSFPTEYPMKPPSIILLTPNGRFEINKKICLSISGHHPETWQPSWSVRTALLALIAFMPTKGNKAIGSLEFSDAERRKLAFLSKTWRCETCGLIRDLLVQSDRDSPCSISSEAACQPSTSRIEEDTSTGSESDSQSTEKSNSSEELRDNSPKPIAVKLDKNRRKEQENFPNPTYPELGPNSSQRKNSFSQRLQQNAIDGTRIDEWDPHRTHNHMEPQRAYSPAVFKLILLSFILLSLLILRRVVMVLQS